MDRFHIKISLAQTLSHMRQSLVHTSSKCEAREIRQMHLFPKERKQLGQFCFVRAPTVFTDFKRFGLFDLPGAVHAVPLLKLRAKAVRS